MNNRKSRISLFSRVSLESSKKATKAYSTSFSLGIRALSPTVRDAIYALYGFVRLVDEVVDSFHGYDRERLFYSLRGETRLALDERISTNMILQSFQLVFHEYGIEREHVEQFFHSMEQDLTYTTYDRSQYDEYIKGSAEVVGLMCLKIFVRGNEQQYEELAPAAIRLGSAFQKVNFLRDVREDFHELGRSYFPGVNVAELDAESKRKIEADINEDLRIAYEGIIRLPRDTRFGVYLAYSYYRQLLKRIQRVSSSQILKQRIRIPDFQKAVVLVWSYTRHRLNIV